MRVLIVNTSERTGGAAVAANRLMETLNNNGVKAKMLVRDKETEDLTVVKACGKLRGRMAFLWERWCIFCHLRFSKDHLFDIDTANAGIDITRLREFKEADVIHLHWINQGMLSLRGIRSILNSGKPVVWTMHDIWPATGICHISLGCRRFVSSCSNCFYLPGKGGPNDLSHKVWMRKRQLYKNPNNIYFVACSRWLEGEARRSPLLSGLNVTSIPNPIDPRVFFPGDKTEARRRLNLPDDKRLVCFISQRVTNVNKGISYLMEACDKLAADSPELSSGMEIVILGGHAEELAGNFKFPVCPLGYISDPKKIAMVYNAVDLFVLPSLSENLPNTIMEALACGVPCVGFNVGGIPEMIDHRKNGYVAEYKNADDLAEGIRWVLEEADPEELRRNALHKVSSNYAPQRVAMKYIEVYNQAMAYRNYKL